MKNFSISTHNLDAENTLSFTLAEGTEATHSLTLENHEATPLTLTLSATDASTNSKQQLVFNSKTQKHFSQWVNFKDETITLAPHEKKEIPFTLNIPKDAARQTHQGTIIATPTQIHPTEKVEIINQKGFRINTHIPGASQTNLVLTHEESYNCGNEICFNYTVKNSGTVATKGNLQFTLTNTFPHTTTEKNTAFSLDRNEEKTISFSTSKPLIGHYHTQTALQKTVPSITTLATTDTQTFGFFPFIELTLLTIAGILTYRKFSTFTKNLLAQFQNFKTLKWGTAMIALTLITTLSLHSIVPTLLPSFLEKASASDEDENPTIMNYLAIQWGNIHNVALPKKDQKKNWNFEVSISHGELQRESHLNFETNDKSSVSERGKTITINSETDNDSDGVILLLLTKQLTESHVTIKDLNTERSTTYSFNDLQKEQFFVRSRQDMSLYLSDQFHKAKRYYDYYEEYELKKILEATDNISAFLERAATPQIDAPEIRRIFKELPATYETSITEIRPTYDLISKINEASGNIQVYADPVFIQEIAASPNLIQEISSTPQKNIIFVPNQKIDFPQQPFNFDLQRIVSLPLNKMLFSLGKNQHWSSYVQTSDFVSLSNGSSIPATNLSIIPGEIKWEKGATDSIRTTSEKYRFKSTNDNFLLMEGHSPQHSIFGLEPKLELIIPPGTPPALYRGVLTFTEL